MGVVGLLSARASPEVHFRVATELDQSFVLAHAGLARTLFLSARIPEAKAAAAQARRQSPRLSERERSIVEVVLLTIEGASAKAYAVAREHLKRYPTDAMALAPCTGVFGLIGFSGRQGGERSCAR